MSSLADWLRLKGRVSRAELLSGCNRLIRMDPSPEDQARLEAEAEAAAAALDTDNAAT